MTTTTFDQLKRGQPFRFHGAGFTKRSHTRASLNNQPEHGPCYPFPPEAVVEIKEAGASDVIDLSCRFEKLAGFSIVDTIVDPENNRWGFQMHHDRHGYVDVWVNADPEGNGPGYLDVRYTDNDTVFIS